MSRRPLARTTRARGFALATALALTAAGTSAAALSGPVNPPTPPFADLIVTTRDVASADALGASRRSVVGDDGATRLADRVVLVRPTRREWSLGADLASTPGVLAVEPNSLRPFLAAPDDPTYPGQWTHQQSNIELAWDHFTGGGVTVALIDSGVDATHPELSAAVVAQQVVTGGRIQPGHPVNDECRVGHGTAVAGVIGATGNNASGVSGVLWDVDLIDLAVSTAANGCVGGALDADVIAAVSHLTDLPVSNDRGPSRPDVINMSFGLTAEECPAALQLVFDEAVAAGITLVAGAGNDGSDDAVVPASCNGVISVGGTRVDEELASYSQRNAHVDVAAGGGDLTSQFCPASFDAVIAEMVVTTALVDGDEPAGPLCGEYRDPKGARLRGLRGTSFSAPYVAGLAALLRGYSRALAPEGRALTPAEVEAAIENTARDAGRAGRDDSFGWGLVDAGAALEAVRRGAIGPLRPDPGFPIGSRPADHHCPQPVEGERGWTRIRGATADGPTDPIDLAVAVSCTLAPGLARYAVLARVDGFADALAGSAIGYGVAPVHYTSSEGPLDQRTEAELLRVLDFSGPVRPGVIVMGGEEAIPQDVEARLFELGIRSTRVAGSGREGTAAAAMDVVLDLRETLPLPSRNDAFVVFGHDFADAVAAGQMAAHYGIPVLLTNTEAPLHHETRAALEANPPDRVFVVGGPAVVSEAVMAEIAALGPRTTRLAGPTRVDTALAVADTYLAELREDGHASSLGAPVVVDLRSTFTDALAGTLLAGRGAPFLPLEGPTGHPGVPELTAGTRAAFCDHGGGRPLIIGGPDHVTDHAASAATNLLAGVDCDAARAPRPDSTGR